MKSIEIPGIGRAIIGQGLESLKEVLEDIVTARREDEMKEAHDAVVGLIQSAKEGAKEENISLQEFMNKYNTLDENDCFCPNCVVSKLLTLTDDDIKELGVHNVITLFKHARNQIRNAMGIHIDRLNSKIKEIEVLHVENTMTAKEPDYESMNKEELIKLIRAK